VQGDYKRCERLYKLIDQTVIATQGINAHHYACVKKNTFSAALYDGVRLIFEWLLVSYQTIYVIAHIIYNHPVYVTS
jgi:hypothetical protein